MTTPAQELNRHRRMLENSGEYVLIRRYTGAGANRPRFDAGVLARVSGYEPEKLVGTIQQGDVRVIVLHEDLTRAQFPIPIKKGDKVVFQGGKEFNIEAPDDKTRRIQGELIAWELQVRG